MIGVYTEGEGNLNFYTMSQKYNPEAEDEECIRCVKEFDEIRIVGDPRYPGRHIEHLKEVWPTPPPFIPFECHNAIWLWKD